MTKLRWKDQREAFIESLKYMRGRRNGTITSILTPWQSFNNATTDGIEWHSTTVIGARPATGKTLVKDLLVRGAFNLNPLMPLRVLEFQFEMVGRVSAIRQYSELTGLTYKELCSVGHPLDEVIFDKCKAYAIEKSKLPINIVEEPCNILEFREIIEEYMEVNSTMQPVKEIVEVDGKKVEKEVMKKVYSNTIITVDHSLLFKKGPGEKDKNDTLFLLGETVTALKRKYPIAFIILSQLNRNIDSPERNEDGKYGNFILGSDIFGADALLQHADTLIGLNRPGQQKLRYYGVERYIIDTNPNILAMHFIKCRNGEGGVAFFDTFFENMTIKERAAPPKHSRTLRV